MGDQRLFDPLVTLLEHPRWVVVREAAFALGNLGDKRAVPILLKALGQRKALWDENGDTVVPAIANALGKLGDRQAVQPIRDALLMAQHDDNLQSIRYRTVDGQYIYVPDSPYKIALAKLKEKEFLPAVRAYARDNLMSPQAGLDMLIAMRDEQAFEICMEHLGSDNKAFQVLAIRKLVDLGDSRAIGELKRLANDPDENVRSAAVESDA